MSSIPLEHAFTVAPAIGAAGAAAGLVPTLLLASPGQARRRRLTAATVTR